MQPSTIDEAITQAERAGTINYAAQSSSGPNRDRRSFGGRTPQQPGFAGQGSRFAPIAIDNVQQENGAEGQSPVRMTVTSPTGSSDASAGIDLSYMSASQRELFKENRCVWTALEWWCLGLHLSGGNRWSAIRMTECVTSVGQSLKTAV